PAVDAQHDQSEADERSRGWLRNKLAADFATRELRVVNVHVPLESFQAGNNRRRDACEEVAVGSRSRVRESGEWNDHGCVRARAHTAVYMRRRCRPPYETGEGQTHRNRVGDVVDDYDRVSGGSRSIRRDLVESTQISVKRDRTRLGQRK